MADKPGSIGNLNGTWSILLKFALASWVPGIGAMAWLFITVLQMEASRFTAKDGEAVWKEIAQIKGQVQEPGVPSWLLERLNRQDSRFDRIEDKIDKLIDGQGK